MRATRVRVAVVVAVAVPLLGGACGDDRLTKAELIAKGDALCKRLEREVDPKFEVIFAEFPEADMAVAKREMPAIADEIERFDEEFRQLEPPEADEAEIRRLKQGSTQIVQILRRSESAAAAGDKDRFKKELFEAFPVFEQQDERAREYGFKVCGAEDDDGEEEEEQRPAVDLSPEQKAFVERADADCKAVEQEYEDRFAPVFAGDLPKAVPVLRDIVAADRELLARLRAMPAPPGDEAKLKSLFDQQEAASANVQQLLRAAEAGDKAAYDAALKRVFEGFEASEKPFREYGFKECGG